ncbi:MAG: SPOR domain-containing protein [Gemmatimonadaceae bacterium]
MRTTLLALALVLPACGPSDRTDAPAVSKAPQVIPASGPDQLALLLPRAGGPVRAMAYPGLDSAVWTSRARVPALDRIIAFDADAGAIVAQDAKGAPIRVDLRLGGVSRQPEPRLTHLASHDGWAVYGVAPNGRVVRLTPAGDWTFKAPSAAFDAVPQSDGSLLILSDRGESTMIWRVHPPDSAVTDSAVVPRTRRTIRTQVGDRLYFTVDSGLIGVDARTLSPVPSVRLRRVARSITTTPSGDRIYVAPDSSNEVVVIDRYSEEIDSRIELPAPAMALRMDPNGRYLLARPQQGDTMWVIDVGTDKLVGAVASGWRGDLPTVAPDGALALLRGRDVVLVDGATLSPRRTVKGGAADLWHFVTWNGFRPRSAGLDEPVDFGGEMAEADTSATENPFDAQTPARDTLDVPPPSPGSIATTPAPPASRDSAPRAARSGFTVQFAALRSEDAARELLGELRVQGPAPRIASTQRAGVSIFRVVVGPLPSRAEAERVARTSNKPYWIYEGAP